jgi:DNA-directed RNA polymerase subunit RPC12/RpoP
MVLRTVTGGRTGEDVGDLRTWLHELEGAPQVHEVAVLGCGKHGDEHPTWSYVEADPAAGVARRRCLACGSSVSLLDSESRWTHPPMFACQGCGHSIAEVAVGLHIPEGELVRWVAVAARCVECGRLAGLTDMVVPGVPVTEVLAAL